MPHIFISYAKKDTKTLAIALADALNQLEGITAWVDRSMRAGQSWETQIQKEILRCDYMVVLYSPDINRHLLNEAISESYVLTEIAYAKYNAKKRIIPVMAQKTMPPMSLTLEHYIDYDGMEMSIETLVDAICYEMNIVPDYHPENHLDSLDNHLIPQVKLPTTLDMMPQPFEWITIPEGEVTLSVGGYLREATTFSVPKFQIAKYPITNAQYKIFARHQNGFRNITLWDFSEDAQLWRSRNRYMQEVEFNDGDLPRTNVTWYEAVAYCAWLSHITGEKITLPTEQQWQHAAQGASQNNYPWGNNIDKTFLNYSNHNRKPTSVSQYPKGASPYGAMDMSGNVCEWCFNLYTLQENTLKGNELRAIRGGSWASSYNAVRCNARDGVKPDKSNLYIGFRIAKFED